MRWSAPSHTISKMTDETDKGEVPPVAQQRLLKELNDSGYGFQHAVAQAIEERRGSGGWTVEYTEFPVSTAWKASHIDVLAWFQQKLLLVGECKRVNPAYSDWMFARAPFTGWARSEGAIDAIYDANHGRVRSELFPVHRSQPFHIALEVKAALKGESSGRTRVLHDAISQVENGLSGVMGTLADNRHMWGAVTKIYFLPVIFTTARLYTTDADLSQSDLQTGDLPPGATVTERRWLWYEDNVSPTLLQPVPPGDSDIKSLVALGVKRHARLIAVVSRDAVDQFLSEIANTFYAV